MSDLLWAVIIICSAPAWVPIAFMLAMLALAVVIAPISLLMILFTALMGFLISKLERKTKSSVR